MDFRPEGLSPLEFVRALRMEWGFVRDLEGRPEVQYPGDRLA